MGTTNYGSQEISFDYKTPGKSETFNKLNYEILPIGIYKGGLLTRIDTVTVQISQLTCFIEDTLNDVGVKISTSATINTTVAPSTPYLIVRFGWSNVENNYADIISVDYASIDPKDIIIGRCAYDSGNNLQSTFDYTRRTVSSLQSLDDKKDNLKAYPTESPSNVITVSAGEALILNDPYSFAGGNSPVISATIAGRIDIIYLDENGALNILEGTDNASPVQPDFPSRGFTIAKITRGASETVVRGDQIEMFEWDGIAGGAATTGGGSTSFDVTAGESIDAGEAVYFEDDGKVYLADNREFKKSIVHGIALQTGGVDSTISISKLDSIPEYSGLTVGAERYLGHDGLNIALGSLSTGEYKVHLGTATAVDTIKASVQLPEPTRNQDDGNPVGSIKYFSTYKDRSAYGYLPFAFDNAISQANYSVLYAEIGDIYEAQHTAAGDSASGAGMFYPTPIPGAYDRVGIPDTAVIDSTTGVDDITELITLTTADYNTLHMTRGVLGTGADGVPIRVKTVSGALPTGLAEDTTYFIRFKTSPDIELYTTEADAINTAATTNRVDLTDAVGTFRLTQEGIVLDDAFQGHWHNARTQNTTSSGPYLSNYNSYDGSALQTLSVTDPITDGTNGIPRTTNETRPKTNYSFGYIKAEHVTSAGEPISALRYDTGWISTSSWVTGLSITINHNLGVPFNEYKAQVFVSNDSAPNKMYNAEISYFTSSSQGLVFNSIDGDLNNCYLQIGQGNVGLYMNDTGTFAVIPTTGWSYKVVITKPNLVATYADTSFRKVYDITDATNYTFTLPDASTQLTEYNIKRTGSGAGTVTITASGTDTIEGSTSDYIMRGDETLRIIPNGTNWAIVSTNEKRVCKAWVNFDGTTNVGGFCTIRDSYNVTSVTDNGAGDYTINFTNAMSDANYCFSVTGENGISAYSVAPDGSSPIITTTQFEIISRRTTDNALTDISRISVLIFGS